ncbi:MAG: hypothetical protein WC850_04130 [Candidatus Gracilibacteria bacterium]
MINKKIDKILELIDFLLGIKIGENSILSQNQISSLSSIKSNINDIQDENKLDLILENLVKTINNLSLRTINLKRNLTKKENDFYEKIERYNENKEIVNLFDTI